MIDIPIETNELCSTVNQFNNISINTFIERDTNRTFNGSYMTEYYDSTVSYQIVNNMKFLCKKQSNIQVDQSRLIKHYIIMYVYPIILVFGILGNILSFIVMLRVYRRKKSSYRFALNLAALSLADLIVLIFGCFREYSDDILEIRLRSINIYFCKFIYFNCYLFSCFSSYIHAFISIERWHAVSNPINSKINPVKNKRYLFYTFLICVLISSPFTYFAKIKDFISYNKNDAFEIKIVTECVISERYYLFEIVMTSIDFTFYYFFPFVISFIFSIISLLRLCKVNNIKKNARKNIVNFSDKSNNSHANFESVSFMKSRIIYENVSFKKNDSVLINPENSKISDELDKDESFNEKTDTQVSTNFLNKNTISNLKITIMLLSLPISYLITTLPIFIIILMQLNPYNYNSNKDFRTIMAIAKTFMYVNNSINILFYIFLGKSLRKEFINLIRLCKKRSINQNTRYI